MSDTPTKIYDLYAPILNYKKDVSIIGYPSISLSWLPCEQSRRRLKAYEILTAYYNNYSRDFRYSPDDEDSTNDVIKEFGDPSWVCDKLKNKLLGGGATIIIPLPSSVSNTVNLNNLSNNELIPKNLKNVAEQKLKEQEALKTIISARENYLRDWWINSNAYLRIDENETKMSYLGDGVYKVIWNESKKEPEILTYDPGFCFPFYDIYEDNDSYVVKDRFVLGWETNRYDEEFFELYRDTYELRYYKSDPANLRLFRQKTLFVYPKDCNSSILDLGINELQDGETLDWVEENESHMPFVWVPNIPEQGEIYGKSNIRLQIQLFDVLQNTYTDLSNNAEKLGGTSIFASGKGIKMAKDPTTGLPVPVDVRANSMYYIGEDGKVTILDTSEMQTALLATIQSLEDKVIQVTDITNIASGKMDVSSIPSGVALAIAMSPLLDRIKPTREHRQQYNSMIFDIVQNLYAKNGDDYEKALFDGKIYKAYLKYGALIPSEDDKKIERWVKLSQIYDTETLLTKMKKEGEEIDIPTVLARIEKENKENNSDLFGNLRTESSQDDGAGDE